MLGHELLGMVERDGHGFTRGDLVTATVRRSCGHCLACAEGSPDSCLTGDYVERGITRLHGFARELVAEDPAQLVPIPRSLGRLGVLAEPASICERALRHARAIGGRQPWELERALVLGAGAIGTLTTYLLRLGGRRGVDGVAGAGERARDRSRRALRRCSRETPLTELGGFDLVVEAAGDAQLMADALGLLRRSGVACLLGIDGRDAARSSSTAACSAVDAILENRVLFGSVNAHRAGLARGRRALSTARASAGRTSSSSSSACASRSTASQTRSPTAAARPRSCFPTEGCRLDSRTWFGCAESGSDWAQVR